MKRILLSTSVVGLLLVLVGNLPAQERLVPFFELTDEDLDKIDLDDGSIEDWLDVLGEASLTGLDFREVFGRSYNPADLDFRVWLAWHDATDRIYVAVERADDTYANAFDRANSQGWMAQHDSGVDILVDGDGGRDSVRDNPISPLELLLELYARDSQWYAFLAETFDEGPNVQLVNYHDLPGDNWYEKPPYTKSGGTHFGENPTLSVTEFYLTPFDFFVWDDPAESQVSDLFPGKLINIAIGIPDYEGELKNSGEYTLTNYFRLPRTGWGDGLLLGLDGAIPGEEDTAVERITWARIKAAFDREIP